MLRTRLSAFFACTLFAAVSALGQTTRHVPADYATIQAAINASVNGDTVEVASGTYHEHISFVGKNITVVSASGISMTTIDGDNTDNIVSFINGETSAAELKGFTLRNGHGNIDGGDIRIMNASPTIMQNRFVITPGPKCGPEGQAIYVSGTSSPLIQENEIYSEASDYNCGSPLYVGGSSPQIIGNHIHDNKTGSSGGAIEVFGGSPLIQNNVLDHNHSTFGGAIDSVNTGAVRIIQNLIFENVGAAGTAIYMSVPSGYTGQQIINNTIANNHRRDANFPVASVELTGFIQSLIVANNVILDNETTRAGLYCDTTYTTLSPTVTHNDAFSSAGPAYGGSCGAATQGNGNIAVDPQFLASTENNFHPANGSPAIDSASATAPSIPATDLAAEARTVGALDMGAFEYQGDTTFSVDPQELDFGNTKILSTSASQDFTITNTGDKPLYVSAAMPADFVSSTDCSVVTGVPAAQSCAVHVVFAPLTAGAKSETAIVRANASSVGSVLLAGTATAPHVSLSAPSLAFSAQPVLTTSGPQSVQLTNTGDADLVVGTITASGDFSVTHDCATVAPAGACTISVSFHPSQRGARTGSITIASDDPSGASHIGLTGAGTGPGILLTPSSVSFFDQLLGTSSAPMTVQLMNNGEDDLVISGITLNSASFSQVNDCPSTLVPGNACSVSITFAPVIYEYQTAAISITDNAVGSPHSIGLSGFGTTPLLSTPAITISDTLVNSVSPEFELRAKNVGNATLNIAGVTVNGPFSVRNECTLPVQPLNYCSLWVRFHPTVIGLQTGSVVITSDAPGSPRTVNLSATAIAQYAAPTLTALSNSSIKLGSGDQTITLTGTNFYALSRVRWLGRLLTPTYVSPQILKVVLPAADLTHMNDGGLTVENPAPGGGKSSTLPFVVYLSVPIPARDLLFDERNNVLWASVDASYGPNGNSIIPIDPVTGALGTPLFVGSNPRKLAMSDDGQYLYVGLDGAAAVRRVNLRTRQADITISLGPDSNYDGSYHAEDIAVMPGHPTTIAVSKWAGSASGEVVVFDGAVPRPNTVGDLYYMPYIAFGRNGSELVVSGTYIGVRRLSVGPSGLSTTTISSPTAIGRLFSDGTNLFGSTGKVLSLAGLSQVAQFSWGDYTFPQLPAHLIDPASQQAFFLGDENDGKATLYIQDLSNYTLTAKLKLNVLGSWIGSTDSIQRLGKRGLAYSSYDRYESTYVTPEVVILHSELVGKSSARMLWRNSQGQFAEWDVNGKQLVSGNFLTDKDNQPIGIGNIWQPVGAGDFDGDGWTDIFLRNSQTGENTVWLINGGRVLRNALLPAVGDLNWKVVAAGDLNGDGKADLVWRNSKTGDNSVWLMNGLQIAGNGLINSVGDLNWRVQYAADFDGDGKADLLWRNVVTGANSIWFMNGITRLRGAQLTTISDLTWKVAGIGDFNGDQKADILWRNSAGQNAIWFLDAEQLLGGDFTTAVGDTNWQVMGTLDADHDGRSDIVWRNKISGQNSIWLMNGLVRTGSVQLQAIPDSDWGVIGTGN